MALGTPRSCLRVVACLLLPSALPARSLNASLLDAVLLSPAYPYPVSGFLLGDASGTLYSRALGGFDMAGGVSVASASKLVSQIVFSTLLADGTLSLSDTTGGLLSPPWRGNASSDPRRNISLESLLSFTSGMNETELTAPCAAQGGVPGSTPATCSVELWAANSPLPYPATTACPSSFFYAGSHHMLAGFMAVAAARATSWNALFASRVARPLGLASATTFYTPLSNPHPGGGLYISTVDFGKLLTAYFAGTLLPPAAVAAIEADHTPEPPTCIAYAPLAPSFNWHYGLGHWIECRVPGSYGATGSWQPACNARCQHSSIGKLGAYPFIERCAGFWALVMVANGSAAQSALLGEQLWPAARAALAAPAFASSTGSSTTTASETPTSLLGIGSSSSATPTARSSALQTPSASPTPTLSLGAAPSTSPLNSPAPSPALTGTPSATHNTTAFGAPQRSSDAPLLGPGAIAGVVLGAVAAIVIFWRAATGAWNKPTPLSSQAARRGEWTHNAAHGK